MELRRTFTQQGKSPYEGITFVRRTSRIANPDGKTIFEAQVIVPDTWDSVAVDILAQKYFRRKGCDFTRKGSVYHDPLAEAIRAEGTLPIRGDVDFEMDLRETIHRIVGCWTDWGRGFSYFNDDDEAQAFYDEMSYMMAHQMFAPNSPQWFNTGLHYAYGITGMAQGHYHENDYGEIIPSTNAYERPQTQACFIQSLDDDLVGENGIMDLWTREARLFKYGSGSGTNYSKIRGKGERLSGGGVSSGLMSFLAVGDRAAGAIKSGGTCLAPDTKVYTPDRGPVSVKILAESGKKFMVLSHDPIKGRYAVKMASASKSGSKAVVRVTTDKGMFDLSYDHPVRMAHGDYTLAGDLRPGTSLFACCVDLTQHGYLRVNLHDGKKGKAFLHQMVAVDIASEVLSFPERVVHHVDGDKLNNHPDNFEYKPLALHSYEHGTARAKLGKHIFQTQVWAKEGEANGMHHNSSFWSDASKVKSYVETQGHILKESGRAGAMQALAAPQRMLNFAYRLINKGYDISTFDAYMDARTQEMGYRPPVQKLQRAIQSHFGDYGQFLAELAANNHRVLSVQPIGVMDVYDVAVDCPTPDTLTQDSGHNFVIWSGTERTGSGVAVHNSRRAAKILILDVDHPDIEEFVNWKVAEEHKVAMLVAGSKACSAAWKAMVDASKEGTDPKQNPGLAKAMREAVRSFVPAPFVAQCLNRIQCKRTSEGIPTYDLGWEGEAYSTVSAQNANNSVRASDKFMEAVVDGGMWGLKNRVDGKCARKVPAKDLWNKIVDAAWACGDPGIQFDDTFNKWNTVKASGRINATNPCCFVGETGVDTSEGVLPIQVLRDMSERGEALPLGFSFDFTKGLPVLRQIKKAWSSGVVDRLVQVTTQRGLVLQSTPEHPYYLQDGTTVQAKDLLPGMRLRKIARWSNEARSSRRHLNHRVTAASPNGTSIQARWMWEQVYGPIPDGMDVHHLNEDPTDDRLSNLDIVSSHLHESEHSKGEGNGRFLEVEPHVLVDLWEEIERSPKSTHKTGDVVTPTRWNTFIRRAGLVGKVPMAGSPTYGGRIQGKTWKEFSAWVEKNRATVNDRVADVVEVHLDSPVEVFDLEVEGTHNFGVTCLGSSCLHSIIVHNSEYAFLDDTACNLGSLNLMSFFKDGEFDVLTYISACGFATIALEITVAFSQYPTKEMARNSRDFRPLGLGYANAGALLMAMGMPYDSRWGRSVLAAISSITTGAAYRTSAAMAATMGPFPKFQVNRESVLEVLHMHRDGVYSASRATPTPLWSTSVSIWDDVVSMAQVNGVRNAQVTVVAPTGTISLLMGCDTSGIEPDFSLVKFKKLAGGGYLKIVNRGVEAALSSLDYSKEEIKDILGYALGSLIDDHTPGINFNDLLNEGFTPHTILKWIEALPGAFSPSFVLPVEDLQKRFGKERTDKFILAVGGHGNFEGAPHLRDEHLPIFDCASRTGVDGKRFISPRGHLLLMAAVQPFISGSISKTVNLPSDATPEDFSNIYMDAWKMGVKSIALYRDGSKLSQPLSTNMDMLDGLQGLEEDAPTAVKVETILKVMMDRKDDVETKPVLTRGTRLKLPGRRGGYTQAMSIGGLKCYLHAGEYEDGTLGEIFLDTHKEGAAFRSIMNCFAIAISIGLQYGVPLEEFCDAFLFTKFEPQGMVQGHPAVKMATSIIDCIFRDLAISYLGKTELAQVKPEELIKESGPRHPVSKGQVFEAATVVAEDVEVEQRMDSRLALTMGYTGDACPSCGNLTMVRNGTCTRCQTCGTTTGCS